MASTTSATRIAAGSRDSRHPPPAPRKLSTRPALWRAPSCCSRKRRGICWRSAMERAGTRAASSSLRRMASSTMARMAYSVFWETFSIGSDLEEQGNGGSGPRQLPPAEARPAGSASGSFSVAGTGTIRGGHWRPRVPHVQQDHLQRGGHRHRQDHPPDPQERPPDQQREEDGHRVQAHRLGVQAPGQHPLIELLHEDQHDHRGDGQRPPPANRQAVGRHVGGRERHQQGRHRRQQRPDQGHERQESRQRPQQREVGQPDDPEAQRRCQADQHGDQELATEEAAHRGVDAPADAQDLVPARHRHEGHRAAANLGEVRQQVERDQRTQHERQRDADDAGRERRQAAEERRRGAARLEGARRDPWCSRAGPAGSRDCPRPPAPA